MALNNARTYLTDLISAGSDAQSNLHYVKFSGVTETGLESSDFTVRATNITLPTATHSTETKSFLSVSLDVPKPEIQIDKTVTVTFRVDANYDLYKALLAQMSNTSIPNLGYAASEVSNNVTDGTGFKIEVFAYMQKTQDLADFHEMNNGAIDNYVKLYEFSYCWIKSIDPPKFSYSNANAQEVSVTVGFFDYKDPQGLLSL